MKTLLITRFPYGSQLGGEEIHTIKLAEELIKRSWKIILWTSCPILIEEFQKLPTTKYQVLSTKYFPNPPVSKRSLITFTLLSPFISLYFLFKYIKILKTNNSELTTIYMMSLGEKLLLTPIIVIISLFQNFTKNLSSQLSNLNSKVIWIEHARIGKWLTSNPWKIFYKLWSRFVKIICVSKQSAKYLSWVNNVVDIPNGIDMESSNYKLDFHLCENDIIKIGTIARLTKDKGIDILIKAIAKIPNVELFIVGEGPEKNNLQELSKKAPLLKGVGGIKFLGKLSRSEIFNFYNNIDIFVLPSSEHDPFGLVVAEAMAAKIPTIVTNVCGITDYLKDFEDTRIIPAKDAEALKNAINWYIQDPEKKSKIIKNADKTVREKFDLEKMVDEYEKLFTA